MHPRTREDWVLGDLLRRAAERYGSRVFDSFWLRQLGRQDLGALSATLSECGAKGAACAAYARGGGQRHLLQLQHEAQEYGVRGFVLDDRSLYWGREHLPRVKELLSMRWWMHR